MKVIMAMQISGSRGDGMWPAPGYPLECGEAEARMLIRNGMAVEAGPDEQPKGQWPPAEERAVVPEDDVEVRADPASPPGDLEKVAPRRSSGPKKASASE
jgi:hypothetical protein